MKEQNKFWDKQAKNFNSNDNTEAKKLVALSNQYLKKDDIVLDFACGTGGSTFELGKHVKEVCGVDYSEEMIRLAVTHMHGSSTVSFLATTIEDGYFKEKSYDVITAFNVLHLLDDLEGTATRLHSLLKDDGLFISYTACLGEKKNIMSMAVNLISKLGVFPSVNKYSCLGLEQQLTSYGFTLVESIVEVDSVPNVFLVFKKNEMHSTQ